MKKLRGPPNYRYKLNGEKLSAARLAFIYGDLNRCVQALSEGDERQRLISIAMAYYLASKFSLKDDRGVLTSVNTGMSEPLLRAIIILISTGTWHSVVEESGLPVRDCLSIALRFLPDGDV